MASAMSGEIFWMALAMPEKLPATEGDSSGLYAVDIAGRCLLRKVMGRRDNRDAMGICHLRLRGA